MLNTAISEVPGIGVGDRNLPKKFHRGLWWHFLFMDDCHRDSCTTRKAACSRMIVVDWPTREMIRRTQAHVRQLVATTESSANSVAASWLTGQGLHQCCTDNKEPMIKTTSDELMPYRWNCEDFKKYRECELRCPEIYIVDIMCWLKSNSFEPPQKLTVVISNADHWRSRFHNP